MENYEELIGKDVIIYIPGAIYEGSVMRAQSDHLVVLLYGNQEYCISLNSITSIYIKVNIPKKELPATKLLKETVDMYAPGYTIIIHPKFADRLAEEGALTQVGAGHSYWYMYNEAKVYVSESHLKEEEILVL